MSGTVVHKGSGILVESRHLSAVEDGCTGNEITPVPDTIVSPSMAHILKRPKFAFVIPREANCWLDIIPGRLRMRVRGLTMPLGVLYAATVLRANGFEAVVLDADHRHMEDEAILAWLREAKADVAAFSVLLGSHESAYRVARAYKQECPETLILCGGVMPHIRPRGSWKHIPLWT